MSLRNRWSTPTRPLAASRSSSSVVAMAPSQPVLLCWPWRPALVLFRFAHYVDRNVERNVAMQAHGGFEIAELLDRLLQMNLATIHVVPSVSYTHLTLPT